MTALHATARCGAACVREQLAERSNTVHTYKFDDIEAAAESVTP